MIFQREEKGQLVVNWSSLLIYMITLGYSSYSNERMRSDGKYSQFKLPLKKKPASQEVIECFFEPENMKVKKTEVRIFLLNRNSLMYSN